MQILKNISLKDKHTFHIQSFTDYWADFKSVDDLKNLFAEDEIKGLPVYAIGSGSNLLFDGDFKGLLVHSKIKAFELISEDDTNVIVKIGSGYVWDELVSDFVEKGWSGAENLSGIPGEVGASPVQNIGAYGIEISNIIISVEAFNIKTQILKTFSHVECKFGYRDSVFKNELKNEYIVCYVTFRLSKKLQPNIQYGEVSSKVLEKGEINLKNIRQAIIDIRKSKLPEPDITGNAGSFFKNPIINSDHYNDLKTVYPEMPVWLQESGDFKVSAAWLIEKSGWKGARLGNAGVHDKQSLVLVNTGNATSSEIIELSEKIIEDIFRRFKIDLQPEVIIIQSGEKCE